MRKLPVGRTIASIIGILLIVLGIYLLLESQQYRQKFDQWMAARPIDIPVDFSLPGKFSGPFHQTCQISHGEIVGIEVPEETLSGLTEAEFLKGLKFDCVITDAQGKTVLERSFEEEPAWGGWKADGILPLLSLVPFKNGDYTLTLHIKEGAPKLAGIPQRLVARYMLCGLELMPAEICMFLGIASLFIAAVILIFVLIITMAKKERKAEASAPST